MEKEDIHRLFTQYYGRMNRIARTILCDEQESEDVISDIFEFLLCHNVVLLPDTEERYLLTSVRNQCIKRINHQEVHNRMVNAVVTEDSDEVDEDERLAAVLLFQHGTYHHNKHNVTDKMLKIRMSEHLSEKS